MSAPDVGQLQYCEYWNNYYSCWDILRTLNIVGVDRIEIFGERVNNIRSVYCFLTPKKYSIWHAVGFEVGFYTILKLFWIGEYFVF